MNRKQHHSAVILLLAVSFLFYGCSYMGTCVVKGTQVMTPLGDKPIENLKIDDKVLSQSESGEKEVSKVKAVHKGTTKHTLLFTMPDGRELQTTYNHLINVNDKWVRAGAVIAGDKITLADSESQVLSIQPVLEKTVVYDLTVEPNNNYYANGVLVHNKTVFPPPKIEELYGAWVGRGPSGQLYRIELNENKSGSAAYMTFNISAKGDMIPEMLDFKFWKLERYNLEISLHQSTNNGSERLKLVGSVYGGSTHLDMRFLPGGKQQQSVVFYKENRMYKEMRTLKEFMEESETD